MLFELKAEKLRILKEYNFNLEKDMQKIIENNLEEAFGLKLVSSEFILPNKNRIDTLGFDTETKAFVIIEYKRDRSFSVVDQGFSYLSEMLNNKAEFILEYQEKLKEELHRTDVDWSQSRIIFVADSFTEHQRNAINFKDLPIELWEIGRYENLLELRKVRIKPTSESIKTVTKSKIIEKVSGEVKVYTTDDHLSNKSEDIKELFRALQEKIVELGDDVEEKVTKYYTGYKIGRLVFTTLHIYKSKIQVHLANILKKDLNDPKEIVSDIPESYQWGIVSRFNIDSIDDIPYAIELVKQSYNKLKVRT